MPKSYPEQLREWMKRQTRTSRDKNLVAFLAVIDDVRAALDAGFGLTSIWANLHEQKRIEFGYDSFRRYVQRHILSKQPSAPVVQRTSGMPIGQGKEPTVASSTTKNSPPAEPSGFHFNPKPKKEDLL